MIILQLLIKAGVEGRPTVFLFADSQIKDEAFMEDISMILNTGDVPNLYAADEKAEIVDKMQTIARNEVRNILIGLMSSLSSYCICENNLMTYFSREFCKIVER